MTSENGHKPTVFVAGSTGMVGSAICRRLQQDDYTVLTGPSPHVDLRNQDEARRLIKELKPDWVMLAAAKVGGIKANHSYPADFIYDNLMIGANVIHSSLLGGVEKMLFLGSSCVYPKLASQPMKEEYLLSGYLEPTNEPYAVAKIAGIITAQSYNRQHATNFICAMPANLYGPHDNFDPENSHVIPGLIRKTHEAKLNAVEHMEVWGTGNPTREFLHVDDLADACLFLMENYDSGEIVNIGTGAETRIRDLAVLIRDIVGFQGEIRFNTAMPDGTPRRLLDSSRLTSLGWKPAISLEKGLASTYEWYLANKHLKR